MERMSTAVTGGVVIVPVEEGIHSGASKSYSKQELGGAQRQGMVGGLGPGEGGISVASVCTESYLHSWARSSDTVPL